jgi:hypothetical protein
MKIQVDPETDSVKFPTELENLLDLTANAMGTMQDMPTNRPPPKPNPSDTLGLETMPRPPPDPDPYEIVHKITACDDDQSTDEFPLVANLASDINESWTSQEKPTGPSCEIKMQEDPTSVADIHMFSPEQANLDYCDQFNRMQLRAQIDSGSSVTTTNRKDMIHDYREIRFDKFLRDAGGRKHQVVGEGYLKLRCTTSPNGAEQHTLIHCWFTPTLTCTLISPGELGRRQRKYYSGYSEFSDTDTGEGYLKLHGRIQGDDFYLKTQAEGNLSYTYPLIAPGEDGQDETVNQLSADAAYELWHQRLCHLHGRGVADLSSKVDGMPKIKRPSDLHKCDSCISCNMKKAARGDGDTRKDATTFFQGISLDWGFICQKSANSERMRMLTGINGEQAYLLVADHKTDKLFGYTSDSKAPPIEWINKLLTKYSPAMEGKYACMDLGSELGRSNEVLNLLEKHGYEIRPTAPEASYQNAPAERPHQTIGNMLRTMLDGAGADYKFWPYAFQMAILVHGFIDHNGRGIPHERAGGGRVDLRRLRTWGCRVYVKPPGRRSHRLAKNSNVGIFLGYTSTMKNIIYWDVKTKRVKTAVHAVFDEGMNDLEVPTPNARRLRQALGKPLPKEESEEPAPQEFSLETSDSPFLEILEVKVPVKCEDPTVGIELAECPLRKRAYIVSSDPGSSFDQLKGWKRKYRGAYIVQVEDQWVVDVEQTKTALEIARHEIDSMNRRYIKILLAPDRDSIRMDHNGTPRVYQEQLRDFVRTVYELREGEPIDEDDLDDIVRAITPNESTSKSSQFTRRRLQKGPDWEEWKRSEFKQLDAMHEDGMFAKPILRKDAPIDAKILYQVWSYVVKHDGRKKSRNTCDGRKLKRTGLAAAKHYAACVSQQGIKMFLAIAAMLGYIVCDADAVNAYAQADGPSEPFYVWVDQQYRDWYKARKGIEIPMGSILECNKAFNGHPEAGRLWADKIEGNLKLLGFKAPTQEPCVYRGTYKGHDVLICRQVDDFMFAAKDRAICTELAETLQKGGEGRDPIKITINDEPVTHYNGLDIEQTRDYIKINVRSYIDKILEGHGWSTPTNSETIKEPIHPSGVGSLENNEGPQDSAEADKLEKKMKFGYRAGIGELIYAYVTCRPDIGYAVAELAKFSSNPAEDHYAAVRRVFKYLRQSKDDGIIFWRTKPRDDLPPGKEATRPIDEDDLLVPYPSSPDQLGAYFDAAYATCTKTRRSTGAYVITLGGSAIYYKAKWLPTVATSSTEAEFMAAVSCAKAVKYFRSILDEIKVKQVGPTMIYGDNVAACLIANKGKPTERARHIDIQYFAIQEWTARRIVQLDHVPGKVNCSDALTKALGYVLLRRHCTRMMGYAGSPYTSTYGKMATSSKK